MSRPKIELPPGGAALLGEPKQLKIVLKAPDGTPVEFPCVAAQLLTDNAAQQVANIVAAVVTQILEQHGLIAVPPTPIEEGTAVA